MGASEEARVRAAALLLKDGTIKEEYSAKAFDKLLTKSGVLNVTQKDQLKFVFPRFVKTGRVIYTITHFDEYDILAFTSRVKFRYYSFKKNGKLYFRLEDDVIDDRDWLLELERREEADREDMAKRIAKHLKEDSK